MTFHLTDKQREAKELIKQKKIVLLLGGSRSGKTAVLVYYMIRRALIKQCRQTILRFHYNDVIRSIGKDTMPKVLQIMGVEYTLNKSDWIFTFRNLEGTTSEIWLGGLDDKDRADKILGTEYTTIYLNEASQISYSPYETALTRLAENSGMTNKILIDCNPPTKDHWLYSMFVLGKQPGTQMDLAVPDLYGSLQMNPVDNPHLSPDYIKYVLGSMSERNKKRFLYGEWLEKRQGAVFQRDLIERYRVSRAPDWLPYAVVGVDPAVTCGDDSDETGIVSVAMDMNGEFYVLSDASMKGTPGQWAAKVCGEYQKYNLDTVICETNQGGDLLKHTIHSVNPSVPCEGVRATRGKITRAEPIASLYEQGKIHHVGYFPELEEQMCEYTPEDAKSPDRMDALVWACTYLLDHRKAVSANVPRTPVNPTRKTSPFMSPVRGVHGVRSPPPAFGRK